MEKGFNDDELADIMNEIESLEKEFTDDVAPSQESNDVTEPTAQQEEPQAEEPVESKPEEELRPSADLTQPESSEVLNDLADKPAEEVVSKHEPFEENVHQMHAHKANNDWHPSGNQSSMHFTVEGDMALNLAFYVSGKTVALCY